MKRLFRVLLLISLPFFPASALADGCVEVFGTYLNNKKDLSGVDKGITGRTALSLSEGGLAIMTDSAQGGIEGYQAFGMMQGTWSCEEAEGSTAKIEATMIDFSYPNDTDLEAYVARVVLTGTIDTSTGQIKGEVSVNIYKLFDDPFSNTPPAISVRYVFDGQHVLKTNGQS